MGASVNIPSASRHQNQPESSRKGRLIYRYAPVRGASSVNSRISEQILDQFLKKSGSEEHHSLLQTELETPRSRSRTTGLSIMTSVASSSSFSAFTAQDSPDDGDPVPADPAVPAVDPHRRDAILLGTRLTLTSQQHEFGSRVVRNARCSIDREVGARPGLLTPKQRVLPLAPAIPFR